MTAVQPVGTSRRLLRRLRDVMAGRGGAQARLDRVVRLIAADMVAEVCSCYVMRAGDLLELFATEGLNPRAVHKTRLGLGEGLVGHIAAHARPLALADAQSHPLFAYRPETGEEIYKSLMGVPLLRDGRVVGVLIVQNRTPRHYHEDELETLQVVGMVVAELIAGGELVGPTEWLAPEGGTGGRGLIEGRPLARGLAWGRAAIVRARAPIERLVADDPAAERARLAEALDSMREGLDRLMARSGGAGAAAPRDVLETFRMFAADSGWLRRIEEAIDSGLSAEAAVYRVHEDSRLRLGQAADAYLRERLADLEELANRLIDHLSGRHGGGASADGADDVVLVARNIGAAQLLEYDRARLRAVILEEGSPAAHAAIVARALEIPMVGHVRDALARLSDGETVVVDGSDGRVIVRPEESEIAVLGERVAERVRQRALYRRLRDLPARTLDGVDVTLDVNVGLMIGAEQFDELGAAGVGLCRTEIAFMTTPRFPDVEEQTALYRGILAEAGGRRVVFRTLDIGGDKRLPYLSAGEEEENPAMGWRAIRVGLDRPAFLRRQFRALLHAAAGRDLHVMFPMIATVDEFDRARALLDRERARVEARGEPCAAGLVVGSMVEVPSLMWQLPALLARVDFLSLGSNDLFQFLFASDRGNAATARRYGLFSPPALSLVRQLAAACDAAGVPLSVCGEVAGDPLAAMTLVGAGVRALSMSPSRVGPVKAMCRSLDTRPLAPMLDALRDSPADDLEPLLRAFALDHAVVV